MCGRTACTLAPDDICKACSYKDRRSRSDDSKKQQQQQHPVWRDPPGGQQYYPSHNIAPGSHTPVIISSKHYADELESITERVIQPMKWGLVPSWHKGDPYKIEYETNNCRSEGMLEKRTYKVPLEKGRRCVVLADGFFEWKREKSNKQPYFIYFPKNSNTDNKQDLKFSAKSENLKQELDIKPDNDALKSSIKTEDIKHEPDSESNDLNFDLSVDVKQEEKIKNEGIGIGVVIKEEPEDKDFRQNNNIMKQEYDERLSFETSSSVKEEKEVEKTDNGIYTNENEYTGPRLLTMAGVFDVWNPPDGSAPIYSYSIITVAASPAMSWIHHRMPAILTTEEEVDEWLDYGNVPLVKATKWIRPVECIQLHPVSSVVNNSRNKTPDCVKPVDLEKPKKSASSNFMMGWLAKAKKDSNKDQEPPAKKFKT